MNIDTGQIKDESELTDEEKKSGSWVRLVDPRTPLPPYVPKVPVTESDFAAVARAQEKRDRRAAKRLAVVANRASDE